jgi:alpha-tubulin suppressor-like RCC1 family protein
MKKILLPLLVWGAGTMSLLAQPTITTPPTNQVLAMGATLTLNVTAGGTGPLAYQWFKDSRLLMGATNNTLTVTNAGVVNSGTYYVTVTNVGGMIISPPVAVAVGNPSLLAWGGDNAGQLDNGTMNQNLYSTPLSVASNVVAGAAGYTYSLFVTADESLWAAGFNGYGQLGIGTTTFQYKNPIIVASNVVAVAAGSQHSLFVKTNGTLWAMGANGAGQLGNGTTSNTNLPICVASNVVAVAAGSQHSLFVKTNGTLWAMGYNFYGQLGKSTTIPSYSSTPISVASNVVAIAAGSVHSLFVKTDGTLWAMGYNFNGQLGNGTTTDAHQPINVASNVMAVAAGGGFSLFVKTDGTLWAMGNNVYGQLGNGTVNNTNLPTCVASNVAAMAGGLNHSLFVLTDGTLWAMGMNNYGQLGNGTTNGLSPNPTPVNVAHLTVANVFPADQANHSLVIGINFNATVTLSNLNQLYTGSAINVLASTTPPGLTINLTYNGSPAAPTNAGSYTVIGTISDPNYVGSATNTLVVGLPPQSLTASNTGGTNSPQLTLQFTGTSGYPYILQSATNLTPPINWHPVLTNPADSNGNWQFTDTNMNGDQKFYRAMGQ